MKRPTIILIVVIISFAAIATSINSTCADELKTPDEVATFSASKYDALTSLKVLCTATSASTGSVSTAQIEFKRPDALRIDGTYMGSHPYACVSKAGNAQASMHGIWKKQDNAGMMIAYLTGVAQGAPTTVPALLLHTDWGYPYHAGGYTKNVGAEKLNGRTTYRIAMALTGVLRIYWIDKETGMILKEFDELSLGRHKSATTRVYNYQAIDGEIDDSVFAMPS